MSAPESDKAGVRQVIRALRAADHVVYAVEDGASERHDFAPDASEDDIIAEVMSCDDGYLLVRLPRPVDETGKVTSFVYFVFGNDPEEVVCDHGVNLSPILDPLTRGWWN
jgi:hypothetical protein